MINYISCTAGAGDCIIPYNMAKSARHEEVSLQDIGKVFAYFQ